MEAEHKISEETDVNKEESEHRIFDIIYKKQIELWMEGRTTLESNWMKEYAHILNQYISQSMQISIMELPDYEDKILNGQLVILQRIRLLIHIKIRATYPTMSLADVMSRLVNPRQKDNKYIID